MRHHQLQLGGFGDDGGICLVVTGNLACALTGQLLINNGREYDIPRHIKSGRFCHGQHAGNQATFHII